MDIYLKKAALHIVDRESGDPIYSQSELDLTKEYVREYLIKKNSKVIFRPNQNRNASRGLNICIIKPTSRT